MRSRTFYQKLLLIVLVLAFAAPLWAETDVDWKAFSANLTKALKSDNPGLQQSAMCMMVQYGNNLDISRDTVFDIVRIFRTDKDENVRLLAMMALYKIEDPWAMDYLKRHRRFEKKDRVKRLCCCAVQSYYAKMKSSKNETILASATHEVIENHNVKSAEQIESEQY